ncbi:MAG: YebC/PmpR family DNA-binding transcriptional regulator [Synechococcaceae cyanobacterium RL_1_2]|nr:YebC/PmpR family DNA-binding transcriptional regulator [Synechococcaceae cyanobacterium RL_1_2]
MAGHSKWANIKRKKERMDAKKGKNFTQLSRAIIVAARSGIPDPAGNFQLRTAIEKAKAAGIPNDNIDRAIAKGAGKWDNDEAQLEEIRYEGYGVGGVAVMVEALTDNRNRTAADLRVAFSKNGGNLGETGCVGWMFDQKGVITIVGASGEESILEAALEADAERYEFEDHMAEIITAVEQLESANQILTDLDLGEIAAEVRWIPNNYIEITDRDQAQALIKLMDALEGLDDVQNVTANFDLAPGLEHGE